MVPRQQTTQRQGRQGNNRLSKIGGGRRNAKEKKQLACAAKNNFGKRKRKHGRDVKVEKNELPSDVWETPKKIFSKNDPGKG